MQWIAPSQKDTTTDTPEKRLWDAADRFRLKKFEMQSPRCEVESVRRSALGIRHSHRLPAEEGFDYLLNRPEAENVGAKVNPAMRDIEKHNPQLAGVLPKTYNLFTSTLLKKLLKKVSEIPASILLALCGRSFYQTLRYI
jgi:type I restriction enzyme M protein